MHDSPSSPTRKALLRQLAAHHAEIAKINSQLAELDDDAPAAGVCSSNRLPADLPNDERGRDTFNRTLRSGRVDGARKVGRIWTCSLDAWNRRAPAAPPKGIAHRDREPSTRQRRAAATAPTIANELRDDVLSELGLDPNVRRCG